ncbi:MAG: type II toxin-antitoxin system VapC family toxin [Rhizobiaceae bacterium]
MTLVDTNVLLDIATADPQWSQWSLRGVEAASLSGPLLINPVIYAELSVRYDRIEALEAFVQGAALEMTELPRAALFLAAKAFLRYRAAGGRKTNVLPDFFVGAHASILDVPLLTRDVGRYRTYFPRIRLIAPGSEG